MSFNVTIKNTDDGSEMDMTCSTEADLRKTLASTSAMVLQYGWKKCLEEAKRAAERAIARGEFTKR